MEIHHENTTGPRRLYRSKVNRIIGGVAGGFAEYLNIDPTIIRIIWLAALFLTGFWLGFILYLTCLFVMKDNPAQNFADRKPQSTAIYWGLAMVLLGILLLPAVRHADWFYFPPFHWHFFRPWFYHWDRFWPVIIILIGLLYLFIAWRRDQEPKAEGATAMDSPSGPPNRLYRSRQEKIIAGVCGGIAQNLNTDPVIVRIAWVFLTIATSFFLGALIYFIWMIAVPEEPIATTSVASANSPTDIPVRKAPRRIKKTSEIPGENPDNAK
ncbi:MAG: PspC domain-containing protein [candidate division KSB1 bacterium]|nr:PspC domain-containing protein [candidate division KSB1 bacterium]